MGRKMVVRREHLREGGAHEIPALELRRALHSDDAANGEDGNGCNQPAIGPSAQHTVAGAGTQPLAPRWMLSCAPGAGTDAGPASKLPAQPTLWPGGVGKGGSSSAEPVEPGADLGRVASKREALDQPRNHLPAYLEGSQAGRKPLPALAHRL